MVRADMLDCIDGFLRLNGRKPSFPFGGVQIILVGDIFKLSSIVTREGGMFSRPYHFRELT